MGKRTRMSFSKIDEVLEMPDLIEVQKNSYRRFLEEVRIPARSLELVGFPKAGKTIAERDVLTLTMKKCLSLHHNQMWSLTPS